MRRGSGDSCPAWDVSERPGDSASAPRARGAARPRYLPLGALGTGRE